MQTELWGSGPWKRNRGVTAVGWSRKCEQGLKKFCSTNQGIKILINKGQSQQNIKWPQRVRTKKQQGTISIEFQESRLGRVCHSKRRGGEKYVSSFKERWDSGTVLLAAIFIFKKVDIRAWTTPQWYSTDLMHRRPLVQYPTLTRQHHN